MIKFTQDGLQGGNSAPASSSAITVWGDFGGGTLQIGFLDTDNAFQGYATAETALTAPGELIVDHGVGERLAFEMAGSSAPTLNVKVLSVR